MAKGSTEGPDALVQKALRFQQFGEMDAAKDALRAALGAIYSDEGKAAKARECFREAINRDSNALMPRELLGFLEFADENYQDALEILGEYLQLGGSDIDSLTVLAKVADRLGDHDTVMKATSKIIEIDEDIYEAWELRGTTYAERGKYNEACVCLNMAIDLHPASVVALNAVGDLCYKAENYVQAVEFYESSLKVNSRQPDVLFKQGTALWFLDRWMDSIPLLERYVSIVPDDPRGWNNLGVVLREKGEVTRALESYRKALHLDPSMKAAQTNLETAMRKEVLT
jgi:tetratricopeptide (TPR) repeat protein